MRSCFISAFTVLSILTRCRKHVHHVLWEDGKGTLHRSSSLALEASESFCCPSSTWQWTRIFRGVSEFYIAETLKLILLGLDVLPPQFLFPPSVSAFLPAETAGVDRNQHMERLDHITMISKSEISKETAYTLLRRVWVVQISQNSHIQVYDGIYVNIVA